MEAFKSYLFIFFITFLIFNKGFSQVVWKSDGTIIGSDGEVKKESYGSRFQKQLLNPTDDWPKATGSGEGALQNYFGNDIFIPGTPLLRMSGIDFGSDYSQKLAELNSFSDSKEMQKFIIANANFRFLENLDISEDDAISYVSTINYEDISIDNSNVKALILEKEKQVSFSKKIAKNLNDQVENNVDKQVKGKVKNQIEKEVQDKVQDKVQEQVQDKVEQKVQEQVQEQVEQKVQEQVQQSIEEKIQQSLDDYYDQLEAEYKAKGWTICERTGNSLSASSSSDGCG